MYDFHIGVGFKVPGNLFGCRMIIVIFRSPYCRKIRIATRECALRVTEVGCRVIWV